ncbi:unnamed protein product [Larinioides sclopetarius]|uniref:Uncharacterized protein n=1 Tax=Larinioides sclopetarius TaxID=280406 RepID=A0AAV2AWY7_9ARAC
MAQSVEHSPIEDPPTTATKFDPLKHFPEKQDVPPKKILFLGDPSIGKTTFIQKYCEHVVNFFRCYGYNGPSLVFTQFLTFRQLDNEKQIQIRLMDLPAGNSEECRKDQYPDVVDSIVVCFAVDNPTSFANVWKIWLPEFQKYYPDFSRFYLLGLRNDARRKILEENKTPVTSERGSQIHQKYKFRGEYMECSVEENSKQAFDMMETLISDVLECKPFPATD